MLLFMTIFNVLLFLFSSFLSLFNVSLHVPKKQGIKKSTWSSLYSDWELWASYQLSEQIAATMIIASGHLLALQLWLYPSAKPMPPQQPAVQPSLLHALESPKKYQVLVVALQSLQHRRAQRESQVRLLAVRRIPIGLDGLVWNTLLYCK
jgi:ABC-type sugar transport system permease subunit